MELALKQARRLDIALRNLTIEGQTTEVRKYDRQTIVSDLDAGGESLSRNIQDVLILNDIRYQIRHLINYANMESGVSELLNERDRLTRDLEIYGKLGRVDSTEDQLRFIGSNFGTDTVRLSVIRQGHRDNIDQEVATAKHRLEEISAELNQLNETAVIELGDDDVAMLKHYNYL